MYIAGSKLVLRDWQAQLPVWAHWLEPQHRWQQLDAPYFAKPDEAERRTMVATMRTRIVQNDWPTPRHRLVIADPASNTLMGMVSWGWESEATHWSSAGIVIFDETRWGRGLGYEALGLWVDYLFASLPTIVRLDLRTWSGNTPMMRLAEKLGFSLEARFRKARVVDGVTFDGLAYGVLRDEWATRYPKGLNSYQG